MQILSLAGKYEWRACLVAHSNILDLIEEGAITWGQDLCMIAIPILAGHALGPFRNPNLDRHTNNKTKTSSQSIPEVVYCNNYNKVSGCNQMDKHSMSFFKNTVTAHHICSTCYTKDEIQSKHAATSTECPHN